MTLTSPKHEWKLRKPFGRVGSPWRCRRFVTVTALSAANQCPKRGKPTGLITVLIVPSLPNAICGGASHG